MGREEGRGTARTGQLVCEHGARVVPVQGAYCEAPSCRRALPCVPLVCGGCACESSAGGGDGGRLSQRARRRPYCCAEHCGGGCVVGRWRVMCVAPRVRGVGGSRRQSGGRSELHGVRLKSGRRELVIRRRSSTAQKFWKIDSTHSYVPDRDPWWAAVLFVQSDWPLRLFSSNLEPDCSFHSRVGFTHSRVPSFTFPPDIPLCLPPWWPSRVAVAYFSSGRVSHGSRHNVSSR